MASCVNCDSPADKGAKVCSNCGNSPWSPSDKKLAEVDRKLSEASFLKGGLVVVPQSILVGAIVLLFGVGVYQVGILPPLDNYNPAASLESLTDNQTAVTEIIDVSGSTFATASPPLVVRSSRPFHMMLTAIASLSEIRMLDMVIEDLNGEAELEIDGLEGDVSYYLYRNGYENMEILRAENGKLRFSVTGSPQHVWIQNKPSTTEINDGPDGGDCTLIGNWDWATKTCTLTHDVTGSIYTTSNDIVLDCDGHSITGPGTGYGVSLSNSGNHSTVKNCVIKDFSYGIYLYYTNQSIVINNDIKNVVYGLWARGSNHSRIFHNNFIDDKYPAADYKGAANLWDNNYPSGGNYWSDYTGNDSNGDHIGETPYDNIPNNAGLPRSKDRYPFVSPSGWKLGTDSDGDGVGDVNDNCPNEPNAEQEDLDDDGVGDACEVPPDNIPPATEITLLGTSGKNGWYVSDVQATLKATDNEGGSGVAGTDYSLDGGATWNEYLSPFTIAKEGTATINYYSTDNAGNSEATETRTLRIDKTAPSIAVITPQPNGAYKIGALLNYSARDETSGVATAVGNLTGTSSGSQEVSSGFAPTPDVYTLVVKAADNAGNSAESAFLFFVVYDPEGGFATGGGWFTPDSESTIPGGKAIFAFEARYLKGNSTGKLEFLYTKAGMNFKGKTVDWLVITNSSAQFQGTGTVNGTGRYTYRVLAKSAVGPRIKADSFEIQIWEGTNTKVQPKYRAKSTLPKGVIVIHKKK